MANTLFLRLEGPFQSWGERSRWSVRDTSSEPTKSGVVGLLGCALGVSTDEDLRHISQSFQMGVRCDRQGTTLKDFHTIIGGVLTAEGKLKDDTVLSYRSYLCDASFLIALRSSAQQIETFAQAVQQPFWPYFLGRKACVPARPVYEGKGDYLDLVTALEEWPYASIPKADNGKQQVRAVIEVQAGAGTQRRDEVLSNERRTFLPRYTREMMIIPRTILEVE